MNNEMERINELELYFIPRNLLTKMIKIIPDTLLLPDTISCVSYCAR